ncbi:kinase-like protein, partial [Rhizophagus irregularis]
KNCCQILEWIPYNRFNNPVFIAEGGFGEVHKATWKDGYISHWDTGKNQWSRLNKSKLVALKSLSKSQNITMEFINEITIHLRIQRVKAPQQIIRCYGISLDPKTKNYIMVMNYAKRGNLLSYLNEKRKDMNKKYKIDKWPQVNLDLNLQMWKSKFDMLFNISSGLYKIHGKRLIHRDLHIGNIHPGAIYKSIPFNFENLSEPKNSDDYYKSYENISSKKYSEPQEQIEEAEEINNNLPTSNVPLTKSLQIDFSQLKISDADETKRNFSKLAYL